MHCYVQQRNNNQKNTIISKSNIHAMYKRDHVIQNEFMLYKIQTEYIII